MFGMFFSLNEVAGVIPYSPLYQRSYNNRRQALTITYNGSRRFWTTSPLSDKFLKNIFSSLNNSLTLSNKTVHHYLPELRYIPFQCDDSQFHGILSRMHGIPIGSHLRVLINLSVIPPNADTTTITGSSTASTICLTLKMLFTEPTDVPPNFITFMQLSILFQLLLPFCPPSHFKSGKESTFVSPSMTTKRNCICLH